ncbi:MAG: hypothetical protein LPK26_04760 [Bacillaceae bacterium]|nr:hypothetical protein [Bacillaceae bacterium]
MINIYIDSIEPQYKEIRGTRTSLDYSKILTGNDVHYTVKGKVNTIHGVLKLDKDDDQDMSYSSLVVRVASELCDLIQNEPVETSEFPKMPKFNVGWE